MPLVYRRMPIEVESPEELGYDTIANNLAESSFADHRLSDYGIDGDVSDLLLPYGDHRGHPPLRELVAAHVSVEPDDVLVTVGAAGALFVLATCLLERGSHLLACRPNYATNLETPRAIGADVEYLELRFEDGWRLDHDEVAARLRPETRLVSVAYPHNPTGRTLAPDELEALVALVESHPRARLLVDETYRDLAYGPPLPCAASLSLRALSVSSVSKTYGLPGLRTGWLICRDRELAERFLAAKEQIFITGSIVDEELTARVLAERDRILPGIHERVRAQRAIVADWIGSQEPFDWVEPQAGVVAFVCLRPEVDCDLDRFYARLLAAGTYVGGGHWFEQDRRYMRVGFGWPGPEELRRGLDALLAAARA